jgi:hypothetical protein
MIRRKICEWLSERLPHTTIMVPDPETGIKEPYLTRYYLFGKDRKWGNIYLHHFHISDKGPDLHNHPWLWSFGIIILGGYKEERVMPDNSIGSREVNPGTINYITNKIFHRVDLLENDAWTLFFAGPRTKDWGFLDRNTREFKHWTSNPDAIE